MLKIDRTRYGQTIASGYMNTQIKCDKILIACMFFGVVADYCIENGIAREISKGEAKTT